MTEETQKIQVAVAAANFSHTFPAQVLKYIEARLDKEHAVLQVSTSGLAEPEKDKLKRVLDKEKPIALIGVSIKPEKSTLDEYKAAGVPVVLIDEEVEGHTTITTDNYSGGYIAALHLINTGRKKIAVVSGRMKIQGGYNAQMRFDGFIKALQEKGIIFNHSNLIEVISYSYNEGTESFEKFMNEKKDIDSIFCAAGDMCALGIIKGMRDFKIRVPEDISLIGYDDIDAARTAKPPLTTIKQPIQLMAVKAYETAIYDRENILSQPKKILFKPELVVRQSA